jgi:uncharacterized membrane protein
VSATIFRLSFVLTSMLAIVFLHEPVTWGKVVGWTLAIAAVVDMGVASMAQTRPAVATTSKVAWNAIFAFVALGVLRFVHGYAGKRGVSAPSLLLVQSIMFQLSSTTAAFVGVRHEGEMSWVGFNRAALHHGPLCGVLLAVAANALIVAMRFADASAMVTMAQMSFLVTAPLSFFFLGERFTLRKLFGMALAAAAVVSFMVPAQAAMHPAGLP